MSAKPTLAQRALGLFVLWQIAFMAVANFVGFVPHGKPDLGELNDQRAAAATGPVSNFGEMVNTAARVTDFWQKATGQTQAWWLFAPTFPTQAMFPMVELRWDDPASGIAATSDTPPPVRLPSFQEPADPQAYSRVSGSNDRFLHYEVRISLLFESWDPESVPKLQDDWRKAFATRIRRQYKSLRAYLRCRITQFQRAHPELPPPRQAILIMHIYRSPSADQTPIAWMGPMEVPYVRWRIGWTPPDGFLPLEAADPVTKEFAPLTARASEGDDR
jgi:hypothetical protein